MVSLIRSAINGSGLAVWYRTYGEMLPAQEFIRHMGRSLKMIEEYVGGDLSARDDREIIDQDRGLSSMLMTLNF